ncbi:uncharacterized protein LOC105798656 [Gossypium raimondii]|uniref:uncharacterized protein LOC105798656 n=1 Tax=Gossypium raimondii TaxID=29730 RepID=UPI00063ACC0A|nr:uncharacterized protein LOC105798656 [Gossypium raimondii]
MATIRQLRRKRYCWRTERRLRRGGEQGDAALGQKLLGLRLIWVWINWALDGFRPAITKTDCLLCFVLCGPGPIGPVTVMIERWRHRMVEINLEADSDICLECVVGNECKGEPILECSIFITF